MPIPLKIESNSPYYIGPHDKSGDFITPVKLKNDNFDALMYVVRLTLIAHRKYGFLDGTIKSPSPPCTNEDRLMLQSMLVFWIMNTIDLEVKTVLSNFENAYLLWKDVHERFSVVNGPPIQQLKFDIARCEQSKNMIVTTYFGRLKVLWDESNNYELILSCSCGRCTCSLGRAHEKRQEEERLHQFLMGLISEFYGQIRSTLLSQEPLPSLNKEFQHVCQEGQVREISPVKEDLPEAVGFVVRSTFPPKDRIEKIEMHSL